MVDFSIKIKGEETKIVAGEIIFRARIAETNNELHENIIVGRGRFGKYGVG